jgi:hypothetical protein
VTEHLQAVRLANQVIMLEDAAMTLELHTRFQRKNKVFVG